MREFKKVHVSSIDKEVFHSADFFQKTVKNISKNPFNPLRVPLWSRNRKNLIFGMWATFWPNKKDQLSNLGFDPFLTPFLNVTHMSQIPVRVLHFHNLWRICPKSQHRVRQFCSNTKVFRPPSWITANEKAGFYHMTFGVTPMSQISQAIAGISDTGVTPTWKKFLCLQFQFSFATNG